MILGELKAEGAVGILIEVVQNDKNPSVRAEAIRALGKIGDVRAIPTIVAALGDEQLVRFYGGFDVIQEALYKFDKETVTKELIIAIESESWMVRRRSAILLGDLKAVEAIDLLINVVRADKDALVREAAAWALGRMGKEAVSALISVLNDPSESVSAWAALSLGTIGDQSAIKPLLDMILANQGPETSKLRWWAAVTALRQIKGEYQFDTLKKTVEVDVTVPVGGIIPPAEFRIFSAGYDSGWAMSISKNGKTVSWANDGFSGGRVDVNSNTVLEISGHKDYGGRGYRIVVINEDTGEVERVGHFDLWIDSSRRAAKLMADFINEIPEGKIVLVGVIDEGSKNLTEEAKQALESLGSSLIRRIDFRDSFALIGRKGAEPGSIIEFLTPSEWGTVTVSTKATVAKYYDAQGNLIFTDIY
jgi:hypothetical protein